MTKLTNITLLSLIMLTSFIGLSQETLDADDPSSFILGGGQNTSPINISLIEYAILDVEPDPDNTISFGGSGSFGEAGLAAIASGSGTNEDLWVNFSLRTNNDGAKTDLRVRSNQNLPNGMSIIVEVITVNLDPNKMENPSQFFDLKIVNLDNNFSDLIKDIIGGGTSGNGINNGFQLRVTIDNPNMESLPSGFAIEYELN